LGGGENPRIRSENVNMSKKIVASSPLVSKPKVSERRGLGETVSKEGVDEGW